MNYEVINMAKGIGIILVVIGHIDLSFENSIYSFHMSLFFFLSGLTLKTYYMNNFCELIKKKIKSLYIPFLIYQFIFIIFHNTFYYFNMVEKAYCFNDYLLVMIKTVLFRKTESLLNPLWFIYVLFQVFLLYGILKKVEEYIKLNINFSIIGLFLIAVYLSGKNIYLPLKLNSTFVAMLFFHLGFEVNKAGIELSKYFNKYLMLFSIIIICTIGQKFRIEFSENIFGPFGVIIITSISGIYLIINISAKLNNTNMYIKKVIKSCSESSFHIMAMHMLIFKFVEYISVNILKDSLIVKHEGLIFVIWNLMCLFLGIIIPIKVNVIIKIMRGKISEGNYFSGWFRNKIISSNKGNVKTNDSNL